MMESNDTVRYGSTVLAKMILAVVVVTIATAILIDKTTASIVGWISMFVALFSPILYEKSRQKSAKI